MWFSLIVEIDIKDFCIAICDAIYLYPCEIVRCKNSPCC